MMKTTMSAACLLAALAGSLAGCSSGPPPGPDQNVVRSLPPRNHASSITSYFDATAKAVDPNRELTIGAPQRGSCSMGSALGWVVPVEYKTRSKDSSVVTVTAYYFWFSDEVIRGVTRRMEVCP